MPFCITVFCIYCKYRSRCNVGYFLCEMCVCLYLIRHGEDELVVVVCHQALQEVSAAGCQHGTVGAELLAFHLHGDIAEQTAFTLLVQAQQEVGAVHRRLIHVHRALRLLIHGHTAHTLHKNQKQRRKEKERERVSLL